MSYHCPKKVADLARGANIRWIIVSVKKIIFVSHCRKVFLKYKNNRSTCMYGVHTHRLLLFHF